MKRTACLILVLMGAINGLALSEEPVYFPDNNLKAAVEEEIGISNPTPTDMLALTRLEARTKGIVYLTGLEYATKLTYLDLWFNQIRDISPLSGLTNLRHLGVRYNRFGDISPLLGLANLEDLDLMSTGISDIDISVLSELPNLVNLTLGINQITNISVLSELTNLQRLHLGWLQISDISPLSELTNITTLWLHSNQISDISALSGLTNLNHLVLFDNQISDISALSGLKKLNLLSLYHNQISDISELSGLTNLRKSLSLSENQISDISALSGLTNVRMLYLNNNQISDISALSGFMNLNYLDLRSNQLNDYAYYIYIPLILDNNPGIDLHYDPNPYPPVGNTLSGIVFDDKNDNRTYNPGEEVSGALISTGEGAPVTSEPNGRYFISELTPPDVWLQVTIDGDDYWAYCDIEDGENQFDIMINTSAEEQFNVCSADVSCKTGFAGLLPYVGKVADHVSVALGVCGTKQRLDAGDVLGATIGIVKLTVNFLNTFIEDAVFIITGSAAETPYQLADAVEATINCAESQLWEYAYDHCGGYTSCLWEGFTWLGESIVGIFTGSPVDIRVIDSQGNVMELDANGYTKNELSSPGWIFKGPDDKELALIFDADDDYTVLIVGRPEAGASSTFYLQMMQQSAGGSQQIHTYTNVSISAQGVAFTQIGDNPVLEVDVDGDGTVDLNLLPDSLAMQVVTLLPSSDKNKAGRTMPVKFSLRRPERVDPAMPFVYDEDLEIRIYDSADPGTILQTSRHGDTARDYRIDTDDELYITNFRTKKEPAEYIVEIWRTDLSFQVGSFTFQTLK